MKCKRKPLAGSLCLWVGIIVLGCVFSAQAREGDAADQPPEAAVDSLLQARKHFSFGYRYLMNKQYEDAKKQLFKSWSFNPKRAQTAYYIGRFYNETEQYDQAVEWFQKTLKLDTRRKYAANTWYYLSQIYLLKEDRPKAIEAFEALLNLSPERERELLYLHHLVSLYVEEGDYESALKYARRWGELEPDNPDVQDTVAKLALSTGQEDEALKKMEEVVTINPNDYATLERLADIYRKRGDRQKAFDAYQRLHKHDPENFLYLDYLFSLGTDLGKSDRFRLNILKKMNRLQPDNLRVIELLADKTGSIGMINKGLKLDPRNGKLNYLKGDYYYKRWKSSSAKQDSVRALVWYKKAKSDPQWRANAQRMIDEINPPLTEEEKKKLEFFNQNKQKEEVDTKGKK